MLWLRHEEKAKGASPEACSLIVCKVISLPSEIRGKDTSPSPLPDNHLLGDRGRLTGLWANHLVRNIIFKLNLKRHIKLTEFLIENNQVNPIKVMTMLINTVEF